MVFAKCFPWNHLEVVNRTLAFMLVRPQQLQTPNPRVFSFRVECIGSQAVIAANIEIPIESPQSIKNIVIDALKKKKLLGSADAFIFYGSGNKIIKLEDIDFNTLTAGDQVTLFAQKICWTVEKKQMIASVSQNGYALAYANWKFRADKDVVLAAVFQNGYALAYANWKFRADRDVVLVAVRQMGISLRYASEDLMADKDVVLAAVFQNGYALVYASPELKADKDVVLTAVRQYGKALVYASLELKEDKDVVLAAVLQNGSALRFARRVFFIISGSLVLAKSTRNQNIGIRILGVLEAKGRAIALPFVALYELFRAAATSTKVDMNPYIDTFKQSVTLEG